MQKDLSDLGSLCIKEASESLLRVDWIHWFLWCKKIWVMSDHCSSKELVNPCPEWIGFIGSFNAKRSEWSRITVHQRSRWILAQSGLDSPVPLMQSDPSDLGSVIQIRIIPKERKQWHCSSNQTVIMQRNWELFNSFHFISRRSLPRSLPVWSCFAHICVLRDQEGKRVANGKCETLRNSETERFWVFG